MGKLHEIWLMHGPDVRGGGVMVAFVIGMIALVFAYSKMFQPPSEFIEPTEGTVSTILRVPVPGDYANAASFWEIKVQLKDGRVVEAETPFLPQIESKICLAAFTNGRWGTRYFAVGDVGAMLANGKPCLDWRPPDEAIGNSG